MLLLALAPDHSFAAPYAAPNPSFLREIQARHGKHDWWYVTTDSARLLVRIRTIDEQGLSGLRPRREQDVVPDALGWPSISRIDERHSKFLARGITGAALGSLIGGVLPALLRQDGTPWFWAGSVVGAAAGGWLGGRSGDSIERVEPVYLSTTLLSPGVSAPASAPADSVSLTTRDSSLAGVAPEGTTSGAVAPTVSAGANGSPGAVPIAAGAGVVAKPALEADTAGVSEVCRQIRPGKRIRVVADFGIFDGKVESATPEGLRGLRFHAQRTKVEAMPGLVTWDRIRRVDRHATMAGPGAVKGAWIFGALGLLSGVMWNSVSAASSGADGGGTALLIGTASGAAAGALIGGAIGSSGTSWVNVYAR